MQDRSYTDLFDTTQALCGVVFASIEKSRIKATGALGRAVAVVPAHEYFLIRNKYGEDAWHDKRFIRDFQKFHPEMAPNAL